MKGVGVGEGGRGGNCSLVSPPLLESPGCFSFPCHNRGCDSFTTQVKTSHLCWISSSQSDGLLYSPKRWAVGRVGGVFRAIHKDLSLLTTLGVLWFRRPPVVRPWHCKPHSWVSWLDQRSHSAVGSSKKNTRLLL